MWSQQSVNFKTELQKISSVPVKRNTSTANRTHINKKISQFPSSFSLKNVGRSLPKQNLVTKRLLSKIQANIEAVDESKVFTDIPCLPFTPAEVFVPSALKTLHLYEARYLALLDNAMKNCDGKFIHVVVQATNESGEFSFSHASLVGIEEVKRESLGALVTIRGLCRVKVVQLVQLEPYIKGVALKYEDEGEEGDEEEEFVVKSSVGELQAILSDIQQLQLKIRTPLSEKLQTPLEEALQWASTQSSKGKYKDFVPSLEELISFAALQPVTGASPAELFKLLQAKLKAMESFSTRERLEIVSDYAKQTRASLAAKLALQSLG